MSINRIKPQVDFMRNQIINRRLVEPLGHSTDNTGMESALGKVILDRLSDLEKTQSWLAGETEVSINAVSKWIKTGKISRDSLIKTAKVLNLTTDELAGLVAKPLQPKMALVYIEEEEMMLITQYREADDDGKKMIRIAAAKAPKQLLVQPSAVRNN